MIRGALASIGSVALANGLVDVRPLISDRFDLSDGLRALAHAAEPGAFQQPDRPLVVRHAGRFDPFHAPPEHLAQGYLYRPSHMAVAGMPQGAPNSQESTRNALTKASTTPAPSST